MRVAAHSHLQGIQRLWRRTTTMLAANTGIKGQGGRVLVYTGEGAGSRSVASSMESLRNILDPAVEVRQRYVLPTDDKQFGWTQTLAQPEVTLVDGLDAWHRDYLRLHFMLSPHALQVLPVGPEEVVAGQWTNECLLLVMPGGADLPYCRQLNGPGTASIQGKCALLLLLF